ncbi:MAG: IS3 family transposase [Pikeienuella sp.]
MGKANFSEDFKRDAVHQITVRGYPVREVSDRLGVSIYSLYKWMRLYAKAASQASSVDHKAENRRLKRELVRVTEERDILKKAGRVLRQGCKMKYAFVAEHRPTFSVRRMCRCLNIHPSGFYAWVKNPLSHRAREDARQTKLLKDAWKDSGKVYGYRKLHDDLVELGETSCPNRVARLARLAGIRAEIGYKRKPGKYGGRPSVVVDNTLDQQFDVADPNSIWVSDITYIKTYEGFLYLAVIIDLYSRRVIGWATQSRQPTDLVLQALLMAVWRRKPKQPVLIHTDQGSHYTSRDWAAFRRAHNLEHSMSRRGNCHDNAVAESFFNLLKRERIRRRLYKTREQARQDIFDYIEMFYNPKRKHARNRMLSPVDFENRRRNLNQEDV